MLLQRNQAFFFLTLRKTDVTITELHLTVNSFLKFCFISYSLLPPKYGILTLDDRYYLALNKVL